MATAAIIVGAAATVAGTAASIVQQKAAQKDQKKANSISQAVEARKAHRERVQAVRKNRVEQAQVFAQSTNAGTASSSTVQGAIGSLQSSAASGVGFANTINGGRGRSIDLQQQAANHLGSAELAGQFGQLGNQVLGYGLARI